MSELPRESYNLPPGMQEGDPHFYPNVYPEECRNCDGALEPEDEGYCFECGYQSANVPPGR